jgi:hypothetical protein
MTGEARHLDRRRQPQATLTAIREILPSIGWRIHEITNQHFTHPHGKWDNESYGYRLSIPKTMPFIRKLWIGYLKHQSVKPSGIYAGMNPRLGEDTPTPRSTGYRLAPRYFSAWLLLKLVIPQDEIDRLEYENGLIALKKRVKAILLKTYPFTMSPAKGKLL